MNALNILTAIDALLRLGVQVQAYTALITKARSEGRDITNDELAALRDADDTARLLEAKAIADAKLREEG